MKTEATMSRSEKLCALSDQLHGMLRRHRAEWEFSLAEMVGVLELVKDDIIAQFGREIVEEDSWES